MPAFGKRDRITFTGEASAELFGLVGVVVRRRTSGGHYVYDIQLNVKANLVGLNLPGIKLAANGLLTGVPSDWIELS